MDNIKLKLNSIFNLAIGLAIVDGGLIIGIQIIDFLISHFFMRLPTNLSDTQGLAEVGRANLFIALFGILNIAAIIYRITGIARGVKHSIVQCYGKALRCIPTLLLLYMLGSITIVAISLQLGKLALASLSTTAATLLVKGILLALVPYGLLTCINAVDQNKNPVQAILATYNYMFHKINFTLLLVLSLLYSIPICLLAYCSGFLSGQYIALLSALWFLFCHLVTIVVYLDSLDKEPISHGDAKPTKVVII